MTFHNHAVFPLDPVGLRSGGGPGWATSITVTQAGHETRQTKWSYPKHRYDLNLSDLPRSDMATLKRFAVLRQGSLIGFRFADPWDFVSTTKGYLDHLETMPVDLAGAQLIGTGDNAETQFQLVKRYSDGTTTLVRTITRPIDDGTITVWVDGVAKTETTDYTVNYASGVVTMGTAPGMGEAVKAEFTFHVPVRFGEEVDQILAIRARDYNAESVDTMTLQELWDVDATGARLEQPDDFYYGGSTNLGAITVNTALSLELGRCVRVTPQSGTLELLLDDASSFGFLGGPVFYVYNDSGTHPIAIRDIYDSLGTRVVATIGANGMSTLLLFRKADGTHEWVGV